MRTLWIAIGLACCGAMAYGQGGLGSLSGSVFNPAHAAAPGIPVEAKNIQSGTYYKATSSPQGEYKFAQLPAGTYEITVLSLLFRPFIRKNLAVSADQTQRLDIQLSGPIASLGELPAYLEMAAKRPPPPQGATPMTPDGKPDLSGVWTLRPSDAIPLIIFPQGDLLPGAEALVRERLLNQERDIPSSRCLPASEVLIDILPFRYVQTRNLLIKLVEDSAAAAHEVFLDGRGHPSDLDATWRGHSTGRWDNDTLVIDTVGFNDKSWLFFVTPHTDMLHVTQRLRRPDLGHLEVETTYDDPGTFRTPVKFKVVDVLVPEEDVPESVCENNQYPEHVRSR